MNAKIKYIEMAAQLWCLPQHSKKVMDPDFAMSIAELLTKLEYELSRKQAAPVRLQACGKHEYNGIGWQEGCDICNPPPLK